MSRTATDKILEDPDFKALTTRRSRFAWLLSAIMLIVFYGFILVVAFAPDLLATKIAPGATLSIGWPIGAGIIILAWVLTAVYVARANGEFEALNNKILENAK
ncbi:DUF485 domain-containing protein [Novispirillum sp. DQ9]|uniref:DUF485 domain-containing protein n=1 Tax=Novispirillum sp. DQ9 TaxID=3398612 RepID=UPI003C7E7DEF